MNDAVEIVNTVVLVEAGCKNATASGVSPSEGTKHWRELQQTTALEAVQAVKRDDIKQH